MLAIAGGKGGCGKTTTTLGLASALVRQRKAALAVDADREMPDLHALAGVARDPGVDAVSAGWPPEMVAARAHEPTPGVAVLPAEHGRPDRRTPHSGFGSLVARLREFDGDVLLDCPAGAGPDAVDPLRFADAVVAVTTAEPACLRDAAKTAAMARELGTPVAGAVVSRTTGDFGATGDWRSTGNARSTGELRATGDSLASRRSPATDDGPASAGSVSEGVADLLDCEVLGPVPDAGSGAGVTPLTDDRVRAAHDHLVSALQPKYL